MQTLKHLIDTEISKFEGFKLDLELNLGVTIKEPPRFFSREITIIVDIPNTNLQDLFHLYKFQTNRHIEFIEQHLDEVYCSDNLVIKKDPVFGDLGCKHVYNLVEVDDKKKFYYDV